MAQGGERCNRKGWIAAVDRPFHQRMAYMRSLNVETCRDCRYTVFGVVVQRVTAVDSPLMADITRDGAIDTARHYVLWYNLWSNGLR